MADNYKNHLHILFGQDHYNPLGVVRSLGEDGISPVVILISESKPHLVNKSRYIGKLHWVKSIEEGYEVLLSNYGNEPLKPFIYTCSDDTESFLDLHYNELIEHFYFFNAGEQGRITKIMEKEEMIKMAVESGIDIPKTEVVRVGDLPKTLRYPILTKAVISTMANWKSNVHICQNEAELLEAYKTIKGDSIILQEYITKKNELCLDGVSVNGGEEVYLPIQSEYIRFTPSAYGNYIYFQKYKEMDLLPKIQTIFKKTGFSGVFSMEFLRDKDDNFYFLEINFRNSTWSYAHTHVGVNLPVIWAKSTLAGHLDVSDVKITKETFTAIQEFTDFKDSVLGGAVSVKQWLKDFSNCDCPFYYNKQDSAPFWSILRKKILRF